VNEAVRGPEALLNGSSVFILENGGRDQTNHNYRTIYEPIVPRAPGGPHYLLVVKWAVAEFTKENGATRAIPPPLSCSSRSWRPRETRHSQLRVAAAFDELASTN
jgi:hypothetical protein